jgi:hypothetical protein
MNPSVMALQLGVIHLPNENTVADTPLRTFKGLLGKVLERRKECSDTVSAVSGGIS